MTEQAKITVLDDYHKQWLDRPEFALSAEKLGLRVQTEPAASAEGVVEQLRGSPIAVAIRERTRFDRDLLSRLPELELIAQTGSRASHIDLAAASEHGVAVALMKGAGGGAVGTAELTLGLILSLFRGIPRYDGLLHAGGWEVPFGRVLQGKTVGLVGAGKIARRVARLARAFDARVLTWSPSITAARAAEMEAEAAALEEVFSRSDAVSVHVPLKAETRGLVGHELLGHMKPSAIFINTSRGAVVDETVLIRLLQDRRIAGAGLDVFTEEPLPTGHPLRNLDNVVLTPHAGWPTDYAYTDFVEATASMIEAYLRGDAQYLLNPEALERPRPASRLFGTWTK